MNKEDSIDSIEFYVKQKQIDEMREYTKDCGRDQFVWHLVNQREEISYLKQALNKIRKLLTTSSAQGIIHLPDCLQIIDKVLGDDKR